MNGWLSVGPSRPEIDDEMLGVFADVVFRYLEGPIAVRLLSDAGAASAQPWIEAWPIDDELPDRLRAAALRAATAARALFVVPCALKHGGRATANNIAASASLIVDLDEGDIAAKRRFLTDSMGPPTMTVESGGVTASGAQRLHLYWRLTEAAYDDDLRKVAGVRRALARKAGGDGSLSALTQPIRAPGSLHLKQAPRLVRIVDVSENEIDLSDAIKIADEMLPRFEEGSKDASAEATPTISIGTLKEMRVRAEGRDGVTRFEALTRVIGHWLRRARLNEISLDEAWEAVVDHNAAQIDPPWDRVRLRREFDALLTRDQSTHSEAWAAQTAVGPSHVEGSDDGLASILVDRHAADWRYLPSARSWLRWDGEVWRRDELGGASNLARRICREAAARCDTPSAGRRLASAKTIQAVERIAATDPRIALTLADLDAHPMRLNAPGGVIDLETGVVEANCRDLLMTRLAGARPAGPRPLWEAFIAEITDHDDALCAYLQRLAGYCLTGSTEEQAFFFLHGGGANGKSVFLDTLASALGDYAKTAPFETFAATTHAGHPTELAGLRGARLVLVTETERDRDWAESRIKAVTGGDPIAARFMRGDFFEYRPAFKLMVAGNHRPGLRNFGEAMRRRLHLIPFNVTIPEHARDPKLPEKLKSELSGVLSWMIEGCALWRERGLDPPPKVRAAAAEYLDDEDLVGQWIAECCQTSPEAKATAQALFTSWKTFAESGGHEAGTTKGLGSELKARGFFPARSRSARGWTGIAPVTGRGRT